MKKLSLTSVFILCVSVAGFSQSLRYEYPGKLISFVMKQNRQPLLVSEVTPQLWQNLVLPYNERVELEKRRKTQSYSIYPEQENYKTVINYVSVEVSAICKGQKRVAGSVNDRLTPDQKNILNTADLGTSIAIRIRFKYKYPSGNTAEDHRIMEGSLIVTVVPETEAQYPGGTDQLAGYVKQHIVDKLSETAAAEYLSRVMVKFTVNENGEIDHVRIMNSSTHAETDRLLLDVISNMQKWKPARNKEGKYVKQEFSLSFNSGC